MYSTFLRRMLHVPLITAAAIMLTACGSTASLRHGKEISETGKAFADSMQTIGDLAVEQQRKAPALARAIDALEDDLHGLQDGAKIIMAVGAGLSAITSLVGLFA